MSKTRKWIDGKRAYLLAIIGGLSALAAWAAGQIDTLALLAAIWAAGEAIFIRAGIKKAEWGSK